MTRADAIQLAYLVAAFCFILGLKWLSSPRSARRGNQVAAIGMAIAIVATLVDQRVVDYVWIAIAAVVGAAVGAIALLSGALHFGLNFWALRAAGDISSVAIALQSYIPMSAVLAVVFLGERIGWRTWAGIGLAFGGVLVLAATVCAWFAILLTGRFPRALAAPALWYIPYANRVYGYAWALVSDKYPSIA